MKIKTKKPKDELEDMSLDNFLENMEMEVDSDGESPKKGPKIKKRKLEKSESSNKKGTKKKEKQIIENAEKPIVKKKKTVVIEAPKKVKKSKMDSEEKIKKIKRKPIEQVESEDDEDQETDANEEVAKEHQEALSKLKNNDPELYEFLKKNDKKLLKFGAMTESDEEIDFSGDDGEISDEGENSDEGGISEESDDDDEDAERGGKQHELPEKLEVASDESDFEDEEDNDDEKEDIDVGSVKKVTLKLLKKWNEELISPKVRAETIRTVTKAFNSALVSVAGDPNSLVAFKVEGGPIFNGVIQLCVLHIQQAIRTFLGLKDTKGFKDLKKNKKFSKLRNCLKGYLIDLTNLIENVSSTNIMTVLLKHLHQLCAMLTNFPTITKPILKRLIVIWSTSEEETVRVLAFLCILKITHAQQARYLNDVLKTMYLAYVKNSKFVSPNTLPCINFMRRSLTEMFALDLNVSYQHAFLYIRQLAIHLRNAVVLQKKDSFRYVYNWQYVNSMKLWADVLSVTYNKEQLRPLIYPLVSVTHGVIKLIPSAQYFPLRFHCCRMLVKLSAATNVFIPVLPFLLEVLGSKSFNEQHKKLSMKPIDLTCLLRFNQANIQENAYKNAIIENIYGLTLEYMANESSKMAFPDMAVPAIVTLRHYAKETKVYEYSRQMRQLSDKLIETSSFIENERKKINFALKEIQKVEAWEASIHNNGTPLMAFYNQWAKENERKLKRQATKSDKISDYNLPTVKKQAEKKAKESVEGPVELFPSDDENDDEDMDEDGVNSGQEQSGDEEAEEEQSAAEEEDVEYPIEKGDKEEDQVDIVKDLKLDDWD